ncbi:hypothetical protein IJG78_02395 [Candidatus Saccharibacteria bacterium]|nr:hypothetical protein [Candidatus Saccharibacteria bacterium]
MVIIATLIVLFLIFFFVRHHSGPAHLAMIAGLSVYTMFGGNFTEWIHRLFTQVPVEIIDSGVYVALVALFPILLYVRSSCGGMFGILRVAEAALFSVLMTSLLSATIAKYVTFDSLATQISTFITSIEGSIVLVGIISAYIDIMLYHE